MSLWAVSEFSRYQSTLMWASHTHMKIWLPSCSFHYHGCSCKLEFQTVKNHLGWFVQLRKDVLQRALNFFLFASSRHSLSYSIALAHINQPTSSLSIIYYLFKLLHPFHESWDTTQTQPVDLIKKKKRYLGSYTHEQFLFPNCSPLQKMVVKVFWLLNLDSSVILPRLYF